MRRIFGNRMAKTYKKQNRINNTQLDLPDNVSEFYLVTASDGELVYKKKTGEKRKIAKVKVDKNGFLYLVNDDNQKGNLQKI